MHQVLHHYAAVSFTCMGTCCYVYDLLLFLLSFINLINYEWPSIVTNSQYVHWKAADRPPHDLLPKHKRGSPNLEFLPSHRIMRVSAFLAFVEVFSQLARVIN